MSALPCASLDLIGLFSAPSTGMLAMAIEYPLFWALLIGWIMTVVLHEYGHGLAAYLGGDYTIKERGGLTLNPLQYVDPLMSIILPLVFLAWGGVPLPGGATYIRRDLLRSKIWHSIVSAAGPLMNLLIFLVLCALIHPKTHWIDYSLSMNKWTNAQIFVSAMAFSQLLAIFLNLIPLPGIDGYGIIEPILPREVQATFRQPQVQIISLIAFFMILSFGLISSPFARVVWETFDALGIDYVGPTKAFRQCLHG